MASSTSLTWLSVLQWVYCKLSLIIIWLLALLLDPCPFFKLFAPFLLILYPSLSIFVPTSCFLSQLGVTLLFNMDILIVHVCYTCRIPFLFPKAIYYAQYLICRFVFFEDRQGKFISITNRYYTCNKAIQIAYLILIPACPSQFLQVAYVHFISIVCVCGSDPLPINIYIYIAIYKIFSRYSY